MVLSVLVVPYSCFAHILCLFLFPLQISHEGDVFPTPVEVAKLSELVKTTIDDDDDEVQEVPIPNVKSAVLTKVLEYCTHYQTEEMTPIQTPLKSSKIEDLVQPWYAGYVQVEQSLLFELVTAANFMDIKPLLDLTCLAVSVHIKVSAMWNACFLTQLIHTRIHKLTLLLLFLPSTGQISRRTAPYVQH